MAVSGCASTLSYDVFISFRGEDTRLGFTGFLYKTLSDRGFRTFFDHNNDDDDARRGIEKAIEESMISIIVFSENYASSAWCLDELVCILESYTTKMKKNNNNYCRRFVFPVFYNVDPSHVRHQKGIYAQALDAHEKKNNFKSDKLKKWRNALNQAANFPGCHFKQGDGYEYELIDRIVDMVSSKIDSSPLRVADHPVGLNYRVLEVNWLLNDDHVAGSHGAGLKESPEHPGKRSRLWLTKDIVDVLENNTGTSEIQSIILDFPKYEKVVQWDGKAFEHMNRLQTLIIRSQRFSEGPKNLPNSLRVLEWWGYPSQSLPSYFYPEKLAVMKLPHSSFLSLELSKSKKFVNMTLLNFDECEFITHIPDVSGAPNLEELSLVHCENLVEIHDSVGFLDKLKILNVPGCCKLRTVPPIHLTSLEHLNLSQCSSLVSFPEILGNMRNITSLSLVYTAISVFPYSIGYLPRLKSLELHGCGKLLLPSSIILLSELEELNIGQCEGLQLYKQEKGIEKVGSVVSSNVKYIDFLSCNISDEFIQIGLAWFSNVVELNLSANNFTVLPTCIKECRLLTTLILDYCMHLQEIAGIPPNLEILSAIRCTSLKDLDLAYLLASTEVCCPLRELILDDCENLQEIRGIPLSIELLSARNCRSLTPACRRMLLIQELHDTGNKSFCLPGTRMPEWFENCSKGHSISFWFRGKFPAISLCIVGHMHKIPTKFRPIVIINGNIMKTELPTKTWFDSEFPMLTDHIFIVGERHIKFEDNVDEVLSANEWNHAVISMDIDFKWNSTGQFAAWIGLHVMKQKCIMGRIQFTNPFNHQPFL
ncbi:TMV resistance protein N [Trifolium repens]|nr:TMV resistance protein N [Trifolium repens]